MELALAISRALARRQVLPVLLLASLLGNHAAWAGTPMVTQYTYDAGDNVTTVTDPRGLVTAYSYDGLGQLWGVSSPDTGTTIYAWDAYGRRSSLTRTNGVTTSYSYDAINRLTSVSAGGQTQILAYDNCTNGLGRLCSASDATSATAYTYTPEGWIAGRGFSINGTTYSLGYGYDAVGYLAALTYPDGHQAIYSYINGAVSGITFKIGSTQLTAASAVTWRPMDSALTGWTASNGLINTFSYDTDGRLTGIYAPAVENLGFSYDVANRLVGLSNGIDGTLSQGFGYDDQSRLVSMYSANSVASYGYDPNGNRITTAVNGAINSTGYSATSNQLVSTIGANPQSYGYDTLGNVTTLGGATAYQYDAFNRMATAGGTSYYVSPEGQRLRKAGGAGTTYFAPDASGVLLAEYGNGGWINYVWLGGRLIGREVNGQLEAIGGDQLGRPQVVTNASQAVVWSAQNWPFTRNVAIANTVPLNLGFPGQYYDAESGLWNNGFRDYDPALGRYVESDPIGLGGGINTYVYVGGNPLGYIDPLGLNEWQASLGFGGTGAFVFFGIGGSINVGITSNGNLFFQAERHGELGLGAYLGAGLQGGVSHAQCDSKPGWSRDTAGIVEGAAGYGPSVGGSVTFNSSGQGASAGLGKLGVGGGIWGGVGLIQSYKYTTPTIPQMWRSLTGGQ